MVQDFGLRLLERQDNITRNERTVDDLRMTIVASGQRTFEEVFPEYFPARPVQVADDLAQEELFGADGEETDGGVYDYSQVELDQVSMEQAEREIAMLAANLADDRVTVSGDDKSGGWV